MRKDKTVFLGRMGGEEVHVAPNGITVLARGLRIKRTDNASRAMSVHTDRIALPGDLGDLVPDGEAWFKLGGCKGGERLLPGLPSSVSRRMANAANARGPGDALFAVISPVTLYLLASPKACTCCRGRESSSCPPTWRSSMRWLSG